MSSSHPNRVPDIEVYQHRESGAWDWTCWADHHDERTSEWYGTAGTHAEAIAAADAHCKEASK